MKQPCIVFDLIGVLAAPSWRAVVVRADESKWDRFKTGAMEERDFWPTPEDAASYRRALSFRSDRLKLVKKLKQEGFAVAIASNFRREWLDDLLESEALQNTFDFIVTSSDAKQSKPNDQFWKVVKDSLVKIGRDGTAVVVDDSYENCKAAKAEGFAAVWAHPACPVEAEIRRTLEN